jgi:hypothetical protein
MWQNIVLPCFFYSFFSHANRMDFQICNLLSCLMRRPVKLREKFRQLRENFRQLTENFLTLFFMLSKAVQQTWLRGSNPTWFTSWKATGIMFSSPHARHLRQQRGTRRARGRGRGGTCSSSPASAEVRGALVVSSSNGGHDELAVERGNWQCRVMRGDEEIFWSKGGPTGRPGPGLGLDSAVGVTSVPFY